MNIEALTPKAMTLRAHFASVARKNGQPDWTKEDVMQGFVVDVGDLMKLTMAKRGVREVDNIDKKLGHELADCLWSVLVLAELYDVDLEKEYLGMLNDVAARPLQKEAGSLPACP